MAPAELPCLLAGCSSCTATASHFEEPLSEEQTLLQSRKKKVAMDQEHQTNTGSVCHPIRYDTRLCVSRADSGFSSSDESEVIALHAQSAVTL